MPTIRRLTYAALVLALLLTASAERSYAGLLYAWKDTYSLANSIEARIAPPSGYARVQVGKNSFGEWLRGLPLLPGRPDVLLYNGKKKRNQSAQYAVVDIDVGNRDLQQCADAVIRLRAEYLYSTGHADDVAFNFTSGDMAKFSDWSRGVRPVVNGNDVSWKKTGRPDGSHKSFRRYLDTVFMYAGSYSLSKELGKVADISEIRPGDVFIQGGFPGHAVTVADVAVDPDTGKKAFILIQSYMPAQQMHVLVNPEHGKMSPWYTEDFGLWLVTPEWTFGRGDLMRFRGLSTSP